MVKLHNRPHINNQLVLFPERIDRDIVENDPVRIINGVINGLNLDLCQKSDKGGNNTFVYPYTEVSTYEYLKASSMIISSTEARGVLSV